MMNGGVAVELRKLGDMKGDIRASDNGEMHEGSDDLMVEFWIGWLFFVGSFV